MLKCRDISGLVASGELENVGWIKKLEIRMHLMMCAHCSRYLAPIHAIGQGARFLIRGQEADPEQIQRMEQEVLDRVCDHDHDEGPSGSGGDDPERNDS